MSPMLALGIGALGIPAALALGIGALGIGTLGIPAMLALGIGALGIGALGIGALGIPAALALGIGALGIPALVMLGRGALGIAAVVMLGTALGTPPAVGLLVGAILAALAAVGGEPIELLLLAGTPPGSAPSPQPVADTPRQRGMQR